MLWDIFQFSKAAGRIKEAISSLPVANENDDMEESVALKEELEVPSTEGHTNEEEPDPFGLDALITNSKKDDSSEGKREAVTNSRKEEEEENSLFLKLQREGLISCLEIAAKRYKTPWLNIILLSVCLAKLKKFNYK